MRTESSAAIRERFKQLLAERYSSGRAIMCPTAHDCVTAKYMEFLGAEHINVAGAAPTAVWTGEPECGVVTMTEMADAANRILGGVNLPGKVAVAQGGNAMNVIRAVREYERAGAAMVQIEDQAAGHLSGYIPGKQILSEEEAVGKIRAALCAREDPNLVVAARCDAKLARGGGIDEMIRRLKAYVDAGAEALQPHGIETMEEWEFVGQELRPCGVPLSASLSAGYFFTPAGQKKRPVPEVRQLEEMGWTIMTYANHLLHLHMKVTRDYMRDLLEPPHDISHWLEEVIDNGERNAVLGLSVWRALEEQFVPQETVTERYQSARPEDDYVYRDMEEAREFVRARMQEKGLTPKTQD
jgi:2-methylisocitrate lyase-like PEP mutase family enzyme